MQQLAEDGLLGKQGAAVPQRSLARQNAGLAQITRRRRCQACGFIDTDYNEESFFVRHAYFLGANDPYKSLKTTLKAEVNQEAWDSLNTDTSRPFEKPESGRIAVKVINHLGDEVMKVFKV
jgi:hypothetical protein